MKNVFGMYYDEKSFKIEIEPFMIAEPFDGIVRYNNYYYLSCDRKLLRDKSKEIIKDWVEKREREIELIKSIQVKNKY